MEPLLQRPREATIAELLAGAKDGWRQDEKGRRVRSRLDPCWLAHHFRRIGARTAALANGLYVNRECLLPVIWLALRERGWLISRKDAEDAWKLAALTPLPHSREKVEAPF